MYQCVYSFHSKLNYSRTFSYVAFKTDAAEDACHGSNSTQWNSSTKNVQFGINAEL